MNIKKALVVSVVLYAVVFLAASMVLSFSGTLVFTAVIFAVSIATNYLLSSEYYFKGMKIKNPLKEGLMLGISIDIMMFLIDIPVMVYGFAASVGWGYFADLTMVAGYMVNVIVPVVTAYMKK